MFSSFSFPRPPSLPRPFLIFFCCEGCVFSLHPVRFIAVLSSLSPPAGVCLIREGGFVKVTHWLPIIVSFLLSSPSLPYRIHFSPWFLPPLPRPSFPSLAPRDRPVSLLVREDEIILSLDHTRLSLFSSFSPSLSSSTFTVSHQHDLLLSLYHLITIPSSLSLPLWRTDIGVVWASLTSPDSSFTNDAELLGENYNCSCQNSTCVWCIWLQTLSF